MINQTSYEVFGYPLSIAAENVVYGVSEAITNLNKRILKDPGNISKWKVLYERELSIIAKNFDLNWKNWADNDIAKGYIAGLKQSEEQLKELGKSIKITNTVKNGSFLIKNPPPIPPIPPIPGQVLAWFEGWENQVTFFGAFRNAAYYTLENQSLQILRAGNDLYRDVSIMAGEKHFKEADIFTRRKYSQEMLNSFAKKGLKTITYKNGSRHSIDSYCEMVGRTVTGRAAIQASINRYSESGYNLVVVSAHFRACELCTPYEGRILSIETHPVYPTISDAETQGLFHPRCYGELTEVYTSNGWKLIDDVESKDKILSLNPSNHIPEWVGYKEKFKYDPGNEMIEFKSNSFDLLTTRDHKLYIGVNSHINKKRVTKWKFEDAEIAISKNFKQLRCCNWIGLNVEYNTFGYSREQFAFLLGIFLSEGYIDKSYGKYRRICISQEKKHCIKLIEKVLKPMGFYYSGNRFIKDFLDLGVYLRKFGKSHEKYIPEYLLNESPEIINIFLEAFLIGDGSTRKVKSKIGIESVEKAYYTSSIKMSEQIGECLLKIGKYPSFFISSKAGKTVLHSNGEYIQNFDLIGIRENTSKMSYHNVSESTKHRGIQSKVINDYDGLAYCLELEKNHIMWIRRNGKTCWSGNCAHDITAYFEGLTEKRTPRVSSGEQKLIDEYGYKEAQKISYEAQQRQRVIERNIRTWKRKSIVALDKKNKIYSEGKVREWQKKQREHLEENTFLPRKYQREQIKRAY